MHPEDHSHRLGHIYIDHPNDHYTGATSISRTLKVNQTLLQLYIMENDIGDDGIAAIAASLNNSSITVLHARNCGITYGGATSLAKALSTNQKLKMLGLWENRITVHGARLIMKSSMNKTIGQRILIDSEYEDDEVKMIRKRQEVRKKLYCMMKLISY